MSGGWQLQSCCSGLVVFSGTQALLIFLFCHLQQLAFVLRLIAHNSCFQCPVSSDCRTLIKTGRKGQGPKTLTSPNSVLLMKLTRRFPLTLHWLRSLPILDQSLLNGEWDYLRRIMIYHLGLENNLSFKDQGISVP